MTKQELLAHLEDVEEALDRYADVADGPHGSPRPNAAMAAITTLEEVKLRIEKEGVQG